MHELTEKICTFINVNGGYLLIGEYDSNTSPYGMKWHKCYAIDSHVNISWYQRTGHGFAEASSKMKNYAPHKIHNSITWLNGNKAVTIMMTTIQMRMELDGNPIELSSDAKLLYRTQKLNGQ